MEGVIAMLESSGPHMDSLSPDTNLLEPVIQRAEREPGRVVAAYRDGDHFVDVTAGEFYERCRAIAKGIVASGLEPGRRVALMSRTRLEWLLIDYAILATGGVTVPIYETSSAEQMQWIVDDSGAQLLIVETPEMRELYEVARSRTDGRPEILVINDGALEELTRRGEAVTDTTLDERIHALGAADVATIIYTSGTTGRPKGCVLSHGNLRANVWQTIDAIKPMLQRDEVSLLFLPLAHVLAKIIALVSVEWGSKDAFASDMSALLEEFAMVQPTMIASVPRIFEKVFNGAQQKAHAEGHGAIFDKAANVAVAWSRHQQDHGPHPLTATEHALFEQLVYKKVKAAFGGRLRLAFSGGGPLGERLTHFFNGVGVKVFEGYGLTETSPTLTVNRLGAWKPGTVGRALMGTSIRIAPDGEILAKGPQIFQGYWNNEFATAETFDDDGWFKTGDIGELEDGYLRITGRKKELIVTAAGKNVAPAPLEDRIRAHPLISQAVVVGDARPFVAALITIDEEAFAAWATGVLEASEVAQAMDHPALLAEVQAAIDDANQSVSRAESIRKFAVLPHDLTVVNGELTPTLKVRRAVVEKAYGPVIDDLYGS
ncbi:MAG TPA: long-chain fatty acid--CoA ligase [Acidimicrobiales bacterium]|nr:long-chain fatty acid--CoA ligase [Acidimicrobiales bacterium]